MIKCERRRTLRQHEGALLSTSRDGFGELSVLGSADLKFILGHDISIGISMSKGIRQQRELHTLLDLGTGYTSARVLGVIDDALLFFRNISDNDLTSEPSIDDEEETRKRGCSSM
jgi:hypothetical protein